jgi:hypothetical protein
MKSSLSGLTPCHDLRATVKPLAPPGENKDRGSLVRYVLRDSHASSRRHLSAWLLAQCRFLVLHPIFGFQTRHPAGIIRLYATSCFTLGETFLFQNSKLRQVSQQPLREIRSRLSVEMWRRRQLSDLSWRFLPGQRQQRNSFLLFSLDTRHGLPLQLNGQLLESRGPAPWPTRC